MIVLQGFYRKTCTFLRAANVHIFIEMSKIARCILHKKITYHHQF